MSACLGSLSGLMGIRIFCARDVMTIELSDPPIGELVGAARRLPRERLQRGIASQRGEERRGEEMTVRVVDDHSQ